MVSSLLSKALSAVADIIVEHDLNIAKLPPSIKLRLIVILSKRGIVTHEHLKSCLNKNVQKLELSECNLNENCLKTISTMCKNLVKIDLNALKLPQTAVTTKGVLHLTNNCQYLQTIYLRRCVIIEDECIIAIAKKCPRIRQLNVNGCTKLTDLSVIALGEHSCHLQSLDLTGTKVTDHGIFSLVSGVPQKSLKELSLSHCELITDDAVECVVEYCVNMTIFPFVDCPLLTNRSNMALDQMLRNNENCKQVMWTIY